MPIVKANQHPGIAAAMKLLMDVSTAEQREEYLKRGTNTIFVKGKSGREYRISTTDGGIYEWWSDGTGVFHCIHFRDSYQIVPQQYTNDDVNMLRLDQAIAIKLLIECDEKTFRRVSGHHGRVT